MNKLFIALALLITFGHSLTCSQGSVSSPGSICISPNYIEGCFQYLSEAKCKTCNYRYVLNEDGLCEIDA